MQGLEKFVDSMQGKAYTAVFIAENVGYEKLIDLKRDYENIYTQIWRKEGIGQYRAIIQLVHGMEESKNKIWQFWILATHSIL